MSEVKITAEPRTQFGKGGARRTRRAGMVPAVVYGHGEAPMHIALPARELAAALRHGGMTQVLDISVNGEQTLALPKAIQKDPIKDSYEHVDLVIVRRGERVTVDVPVRLIGEAVRDTLVMHDRDRISITADALTLPDHLEVSIEGLEPGSHVTAGDVILPDGVDLVADADLVIAFINAAPTAMELEPEGEAAEEAEEGEGEAAPATTETTEG